MGKMIKATCSICGETFNSRTRPNSIRKIGKHWRTEHPEALSRRIKAGKRFSEENPSILPEGVKASWKLIEVFHDEKIK